MVVVDLKSSPGIPDLMQKYTLDAMPVSITVDTIHTHITYVEAIYGYCYYPKFDAFSITS